MLRRLTDRPRDGGIVGDQIFDLKAKSTTNGGIAQINYTS